MQGSGVRVSREALLSSSGPAFEHELDIYVAALAELGTLSPAEFAARYIEYTDVADLAAHAAAVLSGGPEVEAQLFSLTKHGIFKCAGAGGVCALVKTEPAVRAFAADAMVEAKGGGGEAPSLALGESGGRLRPSSPPFQPLGRLYSSWDSVCYLGRSCVDLTASCPSWLHRDARLGLAACDGVQTMVNLSSSEQDGPAGDACFVYVPGSHAPQHTAESLAAAGADMAVVSKLFKADFVQARCVVPAAAGSSVPEASLLWTPGAELVRAKIPARGAVAWDSRVLHSGSLFTQPGRPQPRRTKYVHYFEAGVKAGQASSFAVPARALNLAVTKTKGFTLAMVRPDEAYTLERFEAEFPGVSPRPVYPVAVTTPHRGSRKNGSGKFDLFRAGKRQRYLTDLNEKLDHPLVRNFFSLPFMLARALHLLYPEELAGLPCSKLAGLCAEAMVCGLPSERLAEHSKQAAERLATLARLHGL
jgi:hypothetical protein